MIGFPFHQSANVSVALIYFQTQRICTFLQNKLKSSQKDKVRQFMIFTQSDSITALNCLQQNDWKLDVATDNFFQNPDIYVQNLKGTLDRKRLEQLYIRYRGKHNKMDLAFIKVHGKALTLHCTNRRVHQRPQLFCVGIQRFPEVIRGT